LKESSIDPATFTFLRILSGAVALWLIMSVRERMIVEKTTSPLIESGSSSSVVARHVLFRYGDWISAAALFVYAAGFSFAYVSLSAGTGALLLFGAVQATMILWGLHRGERLNTIQIVGFILAISGFVVLVFPGLSAPPLAGSIFMLGAGAAWGIYSLRGKGGRNPTSATTGNFLRAVPFAAALSIFSASSIHMHPEGIVYAAISGAITSGVGYVIWYGALAELKATTAAIVQLSVPVLAATGGILLLSEPITLRYMLASVAVLGGIALVVVTSQLDINSPKR
jgi:drug/metabolite transporter (DMT)-like permease